MQGQLRREALQFTITTSCAHCGEPIHIEMDSQLAYRVIESDAARPAAGAQPLIFSPMVDFDRLEDPSIIDAF